MWYSRSNTKTYHDRLASRLSIFSTDPIGFFFRVCALSISISMSLCLCFIARCVQCSYSKNHNKNQLKSKQYACHTHMLLYVLRTWMLVASSNARLKWREKGEYFCLLFAMRFLSLLPLLSICSSFYFPSEVFVSYRPNQRDREIWLIVYMA